MIDLRGRIPSKLQAGIYFVHASRAQSRQVVHQKVSCRLQFATHAGCHIFPGRREFVQSELVPSPLRGQITRLSHFDPVLFEDFLVVPECFHMSVLKTTNVKMKYVVIIYEIPVYMNCS